MKKEKIVDDAGTCYTLIDKIGNGGSGVVWKATANNEDYAIKFLDSTESIKKNGLRRNLKVTAKKPPQ